MPEERIYNLDSLHANGLGVDQDDVKVLMWYTLGLPGLRDEGASNALPRVEFRDVRQTILLATDRCGGNGTVMDGTKPGRSLPGQA